MSGDIKQQLNRKRSNTLMPLGQLQEIETRENRRPGRVYSVSSEIIPQTLTHPDDDVVYNTKKTKSPTDSTPRWTHVGFQSILPGAGMRRSNMNLSSQESLTERHMLPRRSMDSITNRSMRDDFRISEEDLSGESINTTISNGREKRRGSILSANIEPINTKDRSSRLSKSTSNKSSSSLSSSVLSGSLPKKKNPFLKVTRRIFQNKKSRHVNDAIEPAIPNSLSKFLHSSVNRHKSPVQFIHNTTGGVVDSGRSVYSFNPSVANNANDVALAITQQDDSIDAANIAILHELLKNLPSLEANYKSFTPQELHILSGNIWGIYCSIIVELFKIQRVWQLPAKIEDINRMLEFYMILKTESKVASPNGKFLTEIEEFITTSLYVFENQIVFNYASEDTINTALKRLGVIWQIFYEQVYYDVLAVLLPLENSFQRNPKYWAENAFSESYSSRMISVNHLLLKCFRDSIVLPYYQNFIHSNDGVSKSFQMYILNEEEENGVTEQDKLTLLQCLGILSTIQGNDKHQIIMEELLEGVRMSI